MKKSSILFLQVVIVALIIGVLVALLWEPHLEGRNVNATLFEIYFKDPFLAYVYLGSIPFFVGLYQAFKVLGYIGQNKTFSQETVKALRIIKYCALITAGAIVAADAFLMIAARSTGEDAAGAVALGIVATFTSIIIATAAAVFEKTLQSAVDIKSENDLTV
ncbi:MAG: hypothetical protein UY52_C0051G0004 [Parcubacteria group bacterium GW2011_GWC2_49_9]|nr:MAG: hypothetical protein UY52_C0051G0004 [Parcubacteria group bacterium GW2011_GWC2_49_9]